MVTSRNYLGEYVQYDSPIPSLFSTSTVVTQSHLYPPDVLKNENNFVNVLCSFDGIFCGMLEADFYFLWNPSMRKFKLLPPLENPYEYYFSISFGYDHFIDNYKVILVSDKNEVSVNTLGTDYWRRIEDLPYSCRICRRGVFVSGTLNWLTLDDSKILSLDLKKESYQPLLLPDYECHSRIFLDVVRDCLCVSAASDMFMDVWIMKHYGNKESWTKLYIVPNMQDWGLEAYNALYISEDDQLLVECLEIESGNHKLVVYDSKTGTLNIPEFQNKYDMIVTIRSNVYIESLISP